MDYTLNDNEMRGRRGRGGPKRYRNRHGARGEGRGHSGGHAGRGGGRGYAGGFDGRGPRRARGRRGDVRNAILALLSEEPHNGYQLITAIADRSDGLWRPSAGSIYPALALLQDEGLIQSVEGSGKTFQLTQAGQQYMTEHSDTLSEPWTKVAGPRNGRFNVERELAPLGLALHQVALAGSAEQVTQARTILDDARRAVYRLLAEDSPTS